ncbi:MAG TPA: SigE family RNA polymerase sigma factor [Streptosporangiaceae bacterium]
MAPRPLAHLSADPPGPDDQEPADAVSALYNEHALAMIRLAHIMLGSRTAAEDVVQEAFLGLYRRWEHLASKDSAVGYVRSSVLNGCRSALRRGQRRELVPHQPPASSAESEVLSRQERGEVVTALLRLSSRQREVIVLSYYLDLSDIQIAADLGVRPVTIRSTRHRALTALGRMLRETP